MLTSLELVYSSLQTGFLAFTVYLSVNILKTLLQGRLIWSKWTSACHMHDRDDCSRGDCIDDGGEDCIDDGDDSTDCGGDPKIVTIVLQVPRILPPTSLDFRTMETESLGDISLDDIVTNVLFTPSTFSILNEEVQASVEEVMKNHGRKGWNSVVNVQECFYSGGQINNCLKPVVTIMDMYYTGSPKLEDIIFSDLLDSLIDTICNNVWKGKIHVTTSKSKVVPHVGSKFSRTAAMWESRARLERPTFQKVEVSTVHRHF